VRTLMPPVPDALTSWRWRSSSSSADGGGAPPAAPPPPRPSCEASSGRCSEEDEAFRAGVFLLAGSGLEAGVGRPDSSPSAWDRGHQRSGPVEPRPGGGA